MALMNRSPTPFSASCKRLAAMKMLTRFPKDAELDVTSTYQTMHVLGVCQNKCITSVVMQVVLELHDVKDRLQPATDLLKTNNFTVTTARDFPPANVMVYGKKL